MIRQGWKQKQSNALARQAEKTEKEASPEYQRIRAERQAILYAIEQDREDQAAKEREEREGPARAVAEILVDRLGDDLPEILKAITKVGGLAKITAHLEMAYTQIARSRREAAAAAAVVEREAQLAIDRQHVLATRNARIERERERAAERKASRAATEAA